MNILDDAREIYRVYRIIDAQGELLYVGVTANIERRSTEHRARFGRDITIKSSVLMGGLAAAHYEWSLINRLQPPHNRAYTKRDRRLVGGPRG